MKYCCIYCKSYTERRIKSRLGNCSKQGPMCKEAYIGRNCYDDECRYSDSKLNARAFDKPIIPVSELHKNCFEEI